MIGLLVLVAIVAVLYWAFSKEESPSEVINKEIDSMLSKTQTKIENFSFRSIFEPTQYKQEWFINDIPSAATTEEQIKSLLSTKSLKGPYGLNLLHPQDIRSLPTLPLDLPNPNNDHSDNKIKKLNNHIEDIRFKLMADINKANKLKETYNLGQQSAIEDIARLTLIRHAIPKLFQGEIDIFYEPGSRIILVDLKIPDLSAISIVKQKEKKYGYDWVNASAKVQKKLKEDLLYSLCIRAGYLIANSDAHDNIDLIAINARQSWFDPATGAPKEGVIASLQASKNDFLSLQIDRIEPKACFRHLKGISTPSIDNITKINPIVNFDMNDRRIIANKDVSESLDPNANLAEMPWDDFEHLVRQLFEWEFSSKGIEVKVTCASRDRGVDAIMFDPDPLIGGKIVLQAKRYTRTVDVAAVRELYGTVLNEGANKGILVTTSGYGPDAYEFAKDKPIALVDGPDLVQRLTKHGKNYHVKFDK
jgi:restriction system protein